MVKPESPDYGPLGRPLRFADQVDVGVEAVEGAAVTLMVGDVTILAIPVGIDAIGACASLSAAIHHALRLAWPDTRTLRRREDA